MSWRLVALFPTQGSCCVDLVQSRRGGAVVRVQGRSLRRIEEKRNLYVSASGGEVRAEWLSLKSGVAWSEPDGLIIGSEGRPFYMGFRRGLPPPGERMWWVARGKSLGEKFRRLAAVRFVDYSGVWISGIGRTAELSALALLALLGLIAIVTPATSFWDRVAAVLAGGMVAMTLVMIVDVMRVSRRRARAKPKRQN